MVPTLSKVHPSILNYDFLLIFYIKKTLLRYFTISVSPFNVFPRFYNVCYIYNEHEFVEHLELP
jgi:hypothetical protein